MNLGYSYKEMRHICKTYDIDYKSYIKVDTRKIDKNILLNEVLKNTKFMSTRALKNKLFKYNLKEKVCENCGLIDVWRGQPIVLELHHIDGNRYNNALDNLKILCPNCHSQQNHFRGNNKLSAAEKAKLTNVTPINKRIKKSVKSDGKLNYKICKTCGKQYTGKNKSFCSRECASKYMRHRIMPKEQFIDLIKKHTSVLQLSKEIGISDNALKKWFKYYNINIYDYGYRKLSNTNSYR